MTGENIFLLEIITVISRCSGSCVLCLSLVVFREIKSLHKINTSISSPDTLVNIKKLHFITKKIYGGR